MIHMSLQVCFMASGRMLEPIPNKQTKLSLSIELIWANYKPKYVSGFNGPLNPIINISLYLGLR